MLKTNLSRDTHEINSQNQGSNPNGTWLVELAIERSPYEGIL